MTLEDDLPQPAVPHNRTLSSYVPVWEIRARCLVNREPSVLRIPQRLSLIVIDVA